MQGILIVALALLLGIAESSSCVFASEMNDAVVLIECPKTLPEAMPKEFSHLIEVVNILHTQVVAGEITSIKDTLVEHGLLPRGHTWQIRLGYGSLPNSGISHVAITISSPDEPNRGLSFGFGKRGVNEILQTNMLWKGSCLIAVSNGKVMLYRERALAPEEESARKWLYFVGLQVKWSDEGSIVSEDVLKTPSPWKIGKPVPEPSELQSEV